MNITFHWKFSMNRFNCRLPPRRGASSLLALVPAMMLLAACSTPQFKPQKSNITQLYDGPSGVVHEASESLTDAAAAIRLADQLFQAGNRDEALYYYVKALEFDDQNRRVLDQIGHIHAEKGNAEPAEIAYRLALKLDTKDADALSGLGIIQLKTGKLAEAKRSLLAAVAINQGLWRAWNGLGLIADNGGDYDTAAQYYEKALKIKPDTPLLLNNLGYSKYLSGDWQAAMQLFDAASKLDEKYDVAWLNKGLVYARQGDGKAAIEAFRHVLDDADAHNNLGYIYMMDGNTDIAYDYFQKAISLSPTYHKLAHENLNRLRTIKN